MKLTHDESVKKSIEIVQHWIAICKEEKYFIPYMAAIDKQDKLHSFYSLPPEFLVKMLRDIANDIEKGTFNKSVKL